MKEDIIFQLRNTLHDTPERSMQETKTKCILQEFIRTHTHSLAVVDRGSWFYAYKKGNAQTHAIAFRADYDAVVCSDGAARHLCGHDGHSAVLAGFALWLDQVSVDDDVYLIFQPGEETGEGALLCASLIEEKNIDEIYGFHNIPGYECTEVILPAHTFACASTGLEIRLTGKQSHAAYPENGINPANVIAEIIRKMSDYTHEEHKGIVLGTVIGIELGSQSYGVSAGEGTLRLTLRAEYQDEYDKFISLIETTANKMSDEISADCVISRIEEFPATLNHLECIKKVEDAARKLKRKIAYPDEPFRWSEDFGIYLQKTKGALIGIGCGVDHPGLHTDEYEFEDGIISSVIELYQVITGTGVVSMSRENGEVIENE